MLAIAVLAGALSTASAGQPTAVLDASSIAQGSMTLCHVDTGVPCDDLSARLDGRSLPVVPTEGAEGAAGAGGAGGPRRFTVLVAADLLMRPEEYPVSIRGHLSSGMRVALDLKLRVRDGNYPTEHLHVAEQMVNPSKSAMARIDREQAMMEALFRLRTTRRFSGPFSLPVKGELTSSFGRRRFFNGQARSPHTGTDIRASTGTPIVAPAAGTVVCAHEFYFLGNAVVIDHGLGLLTFYGHMSRIDVKEGQTVARGQLLGAVGHTGRVTGPHLHWAARVAGARVNPVILTKLALPR